LTLIRPHHGGNLSWAAALADCLPQDILDFSASINPLGPPQSVLTAINAHLGQLQSYPDPDAMLLRQQLSTLHHLPLDWIMVGNGAAELLTWACRSLSLLTQTHLFTPAFGDYWRALQAFQAKAYGHPIVLEAQSQKTVGKSCLESLAAAVHDSAHEPVGLLLNNPHNPTGQVFHRTDIQPLLKHFRLVIADEAFMEFLPSETDYSLCTELFHASNLVIVRSLTKFYSIPGLRLGYALGHPEVLQQWQAWRDPWSVNTLAIAAGAAALQDQEFQQKTYSWLASAMPQLHQGLSQLPGLTVFSGAVNFVLVRYDGSVAKLQENLLKHHRILIRDCLSFPELGDHYFRVAVRTTAENAKLLNALQKTL
jgi:L-threonine-O-3-phosphate decarboxylase